MEYCGQFLKATGFCIPLLFLFLPVMGGEPDTLKIEGYHYMDGKPVSVRIVNGMIDRVDPIQALSGDKEFIIAPGFIDIQINGYMGIDFADNELSIEGIRTAAKALWSTGVTTFLPTVITNDQERLEKSFEILAGALEDEEVGVSIPGFHLEGPYISPVKGFRGAHLEKYIRPPDWDEFQRTREAARNRILLITVAPEVTGAIPFIEKCRSAGLVVSLGHHDGTAGEISRAVDAGASISTHLGNGCANMIHRHNNPLWPQLAEDRLTATLIADGFHLNREELISFYRIKGAERTILVSDAVDLAGMPPGEYIRGERQVVLTGHVVKYPAENVLAGAATPLSNCVANMIKYTGCGLPEAIRLASTNPARVLGFSNIGEIGEGKRADLILFTMENGDMEIHKTIVAGRLVFKR
jgi:N-acetylglucosamine-6-phosphate deacetylase